MKKKIWENKYSMLLLVVPCALLLLIAFSWFQNALRENINQTNYKIMQETSRQQAFGFETKMHGQLNQLQLYARSFENVDMNDYNAVKSLLNVTEGVGSFQTISVANTTGKLVSNHNTMGGNIMKKQYFQEAINGNATIGIESYAVEDGGLMLILAVPIYQGETVIGVLTGSEQLVQGDDFVLTDSFGGLGATFIVDQEGNILLKSDNGAGIVGDKTNYLDALSDAKVRDPKKMTGRKEEYLRNNSEGVYRCWVLEEEYIMIRQPIEYNDWSLILLVNASFVNSQSTQILTYVWVLLAAVLFSMLAIVVALFCIQNYSDKMKSKAELDLLTKLLNKKTFELTVANIISDPSVDEMGALLLIDLDNFKGVNDTLGHIAGDRVLSGVADKMREAFRAQDYLGRIGGDEFAVYFTFQNKTSIAERSAVIQTRVEHFFTEVRKIAGEMEWSTRISCSIGIAMNPEHGTDYETLYKSADQALYQAKEAGKDRYKILRKEG